MAGDFTNYPWPYVGMLPHLHAVHVHALLHCQQCDVAYCNGCSKTWGATATVTWTNATTTNILPSTTVSGHAHS